MYLGDVAFCYSKIKQEAADQNISFKDHFIHLFVHSILHLLGFDHDNEEDADVMESLEVDILKDLFIASPYDRNQNIGR
jgi:probable rRNA maturation factor